MTTGRRRALLGLGLAVAVVATGVWAIPSFAGRLFVDVSARVGPTSAGAASARSVVLPDGSVSPSPQLRIEVVIRNHYPLPVVLGFDGSAIHARLVARDRPGDAPVWVTAGDDPSLESGDDSPDTGSARVVVIQPGTTTLPTSAAEIALDVSAGATGPIPAGIYALQVSAFGLSAAPALISIVDAAA